MQILKFQNKGQVTLPKQIIAQFHLQGGDVLKCETKDSHIVLTPVDLEERYTEKDLKVIDQIVETGKGKGVSLNSDKAIDDYIKNIPAQKGKHNAG